MSRSGYPFSRHDVGDTLSKGLNRTLGDSNLQEKALGIGRGEHGDNVGKHNAVWAHVKLSSTAPGAPVYDVSHNLGSVPVACVLVDWENPSSPTTMIVAAPVERSKWTATSARVRVHLVVGSLDACVARFQVFGA